MDLFANASPPSFVMVITGYFAVLLALGKTTGIKHIHSGPAALAGSRAAPSELLGDARIFLKTAFLVFR